MFDMATSLSLFFCFRLRQMKPSVTPEIEFATDSSLEGEGFEPVWGFSCQAVVSGCFRLFVRSGKAVLRPVACNQVRGARGRGQGIETVAKLGGLPPSGACVSQRLEA
jgi:hypothetical protein